jgi:hypothetical protein
MVTPGGAVSLSGHTHLIPNTINERLGNLTMRLEDLDGRETPFNLQAAKDFLLKAVEFVTLPANGAGHNLFWANVYLDRAEEAKRTEQQRVFWDPQFPGAMPRQAGTWKQDQKTGH